MLNSKSQAGTEVEISTNVEVSTSSPNNAKPNVGGSFCPQDKTRKEIIDCIINYLELTTEDSWCLDVVKTTDGKNCLFGHLFDFGGSKLMDWFECICATTYMVYPVNDGTHPNYKQPTAKQRCIAYLQDLMNGKEKTTYQLMEEYDSVVS